MYNFEKKYEYKFEKIQSNKVELELFENKCNDFAPMTSLDNLRQTIQEFLKKVEDNLKNNFNNQFSDIRFQLDNKLNGLELENKMDEFFKENNHQLDLEN